jgi:hypothetical protein
MLGSALCAENFIFQNHRNPHQYPPGLFFCIWGETLPLKLENPVNTGGKVFAGRCRSEQIIFSSGLCKCFKCASTPPTRAIKSFPTILQRVANPIQPFGFKLVQDSLLPSLLDDIRDSFGNQAYLLGQLDNTQINKLQCSHRRMTGLLAEASTLRVRHSWVSRAAI